MLSALLFDLDGTLADTDPIHFLSWQEALRRYSLEIDRAFYNLRISGKHNPQIVKDILPQLTETEGTQLTDDKESHFRKLVADIAEPLPGLSEFLTWAKSQNLPLGLVTNAPKMNADFMLSVLDLKDTFSVVILGEDLAKAKPDPLPYQIALEKLGIGSDEAIAFEDSPSGILSAVSAGILTVGVLSTHPKESLLEAGAKWVIQDFMDSELEKLGYR